MKGLLLCAAVSLAFVGCAHNKSKEAGKRCGKKSHHEKMWQKMDADADDFVTRAEFDKGHGAMFEKMDSNKDGKISKEEMMKHHSSKAKKKKACSK